MSMHDSCHTYTHARTCRDHSHDLKLRWWRVWRSFALAPHTIIHTNIHAVCMFMHTYLFLVCFFFWVYTTAVWLTLCFSSIQVSCFVQQPVVGPLKRHFCRAFIASVSFHFSRGCLYSTVLVLAWVKVLNVCECVSKRVYMTAVCPIHCLLLHRTSALFKKHQDTRTYMCRQTDRHSGWIREIVAAHTLALVVPNSGSIHTL